MKISKIVSIDNAKILQDDKNILTSFCDSFVEYNSDPVSDEEVLHRISNAEVIIVNKYRLDDSIIGKLNKTKLICVFGSGFDFIDIDAADKNGIVVANIPDYCTQAVAEHVIGLLIASSRLYYKAVSELRAGIWDPHLYRGLELKGKTLGIIGYGRIGKRVSEIARSGFDMNIISIDSKSNRDELEQLLSKSDYISLHVPLNQNTKHLIARREFNLMKDGVVLVNTSRGAVIDTEALVSNIKSKKIFAAGLDVFEREPIKIDDSLLSFNNVILTPHIGFKTMMSETKISKILVDNIRAFISGRNLNIINHEDKYII
ncbi:MAG: NAD(P)-dependent oxidoreductase [Candidatus Paceibacterota bacterium]|jgi:phosphoglycerate dehydrogenase-like enzyme